MRLNTLVTLAFALLLTACGFQLRGTGSFDFALRELDFKSADIHAPLAKAVEARLQAQGVDLNAAAPFTLYLDREQHDKRVVSYIAGTRSAEHMLTSSVEYAIRHGDLPDLISGRAEVQRAMSFNQNQVSASHEEEQLMRAEMRNELVMQLMLRLQAIQPAQLDVRRTEIQERIDIEERARQQEIKRLQEEYPLAPLSESSQAD